MSKNKGKMVAFQDVTVGAQFKHGGVTYIKTEGALFRGRLNVNAIALTHQHKGESMSFFKSQPVVLK